MFILGSAEGGHHMTSFFLGRVTVKAGDVRTMFAGFWYRDPPTVHTQLNGGNISINALPATQKRNSLKAKKTRFAATVVANPDH